MVNRGISGLVALAVMTVVLFAAGGAGARASTANRCRSVPISGEPWAIVQRGTNCAFARYAVRHVLERGRSPHRWRCYIAKDGEFIPDPRSFRVRCYRGERRVVGRA